MGGGPTYILAAAGAEFDGVNGTCGLSVWGARSGLGNCVTGVPGELRHLAVGEDHHIVTITWRVEGGSGEKVELAWSRRFCGSFTQHSVQFCAGQCDDM